MDVDVLIIGSGLAGLNAALQLAPHAKVLVITKMSSHDNATSWAQGGIASVMDGQDDFEQHTQDTLLAGAGLCDEQAVRSIVKEGPAAVQALVQMGVDFDRDQAGTGYDLTREGGHSARRILHAQDITGREINRALHLKVQELGVHILSNHIAIDLIFSRKLGLSENNRCLGAYVLNTQTGTVRTVRSKAVLLASGGAGKVYRYTSNPAVSTGDGVAMGFRAGARIANMEFFQFHPTCLYHSKAKSFLISEALRGEGGVLRSKEGTPFMQGIHPMADLAPRDIVARAIDSHMKRSGESHVLLDMTHHDPGYLVGRFPNIHNACLGLGIDMTEHPIPVVPAAHYACGGVWTDLQGQTSLNGLWAAGEVAYTGLHGANRLASNSLLEAAVLSFRAAKSILHYIQNQTPPPSLPVWDYGSATDPNDAIVVTHNWEELRRTMWNYVGIVRSDKRLERAMNRVSLLREEIKEYYWGFKLTHDLIELRNLATVAHLVVASAKRRRESRGLHYNLDCPNLDSKWARPSVLERGPGESIRWID